MQITPFSSNKTLNVRGRLIDLRTPRVMGILNVTPDSFFDGGRYAREKDFLAQAENMLAEGADLIDVGGYSTRPGAADVPAAEEKRRVVTAIRRILQRHPGAQLSVDTFRADVAEAAVGEGAVIINDISGGARDNSMFATVARLKVPYVLMHSRGTPETMSRLTDYNDVVTDLITWFHARVHALQALDVKDIIIDPGFGFAKTVAQNFHLLGRFDKLSILDRPMLAGISRKRMVWKTLETTPEGALNGSTALHMVALSHGADILRVHDVKEAREVVRLFIAMKQNESIPR